MKSILTSSLLLALSSQAFAYTPEALADQIVTLPGAENLNIPFNHFAGYLNIDESTGKKIFYWFFESENSPANDPVVFWTNGGPGCSGFIGLFTEQGPFRPNADGTLSLNNYAWNKISNTLFVEQPSGVGFSYSDTPSDYSTNDTQAAKDNYKLLQAFYDRFPEYKPNDLYITSESWGGHYMPTLALEISTQNDKAPQTGNFVLPFLGFAVGNPYTSPDNNNLATYYTFGGHQLVAKPVFDEWQEKCTGTHRAHARCELLEYRMNKQVGNLNPYALDYPVCLSDTQRSGRLQRMWLLAHTQPELYASLKDTYEPCEIDYTTDYLNRNDVKNAIHAKNSIAWEECSNILRYSGGDEPMQPIYKELIDNYNLKILVYSGDDDSVCALWGTQEWTFNLGYSYSTFWETWEVDGQTAGYFTKFDGFSLVTVHGAGHEVPTYKPAAAFELFQKYLNGEWF